MPHLLVVGAGPGISAATARRLAGDGYAVGLIARREEALAELGDELRADGVVGRAPADAGDPASLTAPSSRWSTRSARSTSCSTTSRSAGRPPSPTSRRRTCWPTWPPGPSACRRRSARCCPGCGSAARAPCW